MTYDFIVVGAGVSGMASALILARSGKHVALVEKNPQTAAVVRGFVRHGLQIDTGFHYAGGMSEGEVLDRFFRYLGLSDKLSPEPFNAEGFDTVRFESPKFEFSFPCGMERLREALCQAFPAEQRGIDAYLEGVKHACLSIPFLNLTMEPNSQMLTSSTLQEMLNLWFSDPLLKDLLAAHALLYGMSPEETPFALHAAVVDLYYRAPCGLAGGGRSLAEAFDAELINQQVDVHLGSGVAAIEVSTDGCFQGVRLADGRQLSGRGCIFTAHPKILLELFPETVFRASYRKRLAELEDTVPACLLYGGLSEAPPRQHANLYVIPRLGEIGKPSRSGIGTGPVYVTKARAATPQGREGFLGIFPLHAEFMKPWSDCNEGQRSPAYVAFKQELVQQMLDTLLQRCPDFSGRITWCEGATPLSLRRYNHSPGMGLYGLKHSAGQINPQPLTKIRGLLLAGQGIAAPGILGTICSAFITCGFILGHDHLKSGLIACH